MNKFRQFLLFPPIRIVMFGVLCVLPIGISWPGIVIMAHGGTDPFLLGLYATAVLAPSAVLAMGVMTWLLERRSFESAGLTPRGMVFETGIGIALGFSLMSLVVGILGAMGYYHPYAKQVGFQFGPILAFYLGIAVSEEVIFRGYVLQAIESRWGTLVALFSTCLLFGCEHIGNVEPESFIHMVKVIIFVGFGAGGLFAAAYLMTRRLWLSIGLHWAWNFFLGAYYGLPVSGSNLTDSYIQATLAGPRYITGEKFGPECSVITLSIAWIMALTMIVRAIKNGNWKLHPRHERELREQREREQNAAEAQPAPPSGD